MKKAKLLWLIPAVAVLAAVLLLCFPPGEDGWQPAANRPQQTQTEEPGTNAAPPPVAETHPPQTEAPESTEDTPNLETEPPQATEVPPQPETEAQPPQATESPALPPTTEGKTLEYSGYGRYTGKYVEDGFDQPVKDVAVILVTNVSPQFLEVATIRFTINGQPAEFNVRGLPPGKAAWVLEANRMVIPPGSEFVYVDETTGFSGGGNVTDNLDIELGEGTMSVLNTGDTVMRDVYVYYKQLHTDGNFLGGITYRVSFGDLHPDRGDIPAAVSATAGHCTPEGCAVVKVTRDD